MIFKEVKEICIASDARLEKLHLVAKSRLKKLIVSLESPLNLQMHPENAGMMCGTPGWMSAAAHIPALLFIYSE